MIHELYIYDEIGPDYWGLISGKAVVGAIKDMKPDKGDELHVRLNTPGGDVFEAKAIGEAIERWDGPTVAHVDALAASAGTAIAIKADRVVMAQSAMWMIHNAWSGAMGDADELRRVADVLDAVTGTFTAEYARKTGKDKAELSQLMDAETWMTADEAKEFGFVDEIAGANEIAARIRPGQFKSCPDGIVVQPRTHHQESVKSAELVAYKVDLMRRKSGC